MIIKTPILFISCFLINSVFGQQYKATVYDLKSGNVDTLRYTLTDSTKTEGTTVFSFGDFNNEISQLEISIPNENLWPNTSFTLKQKATDVYNIENYPIRTSIKLFRISNDSLKQRCSGSIISAKHVLTAAHCVASTNSDTLLFDSLLVSPIYDNGDFNGIFDCSRVEKAYTFINRNNGWEDIAILELEKPIGLKTGWIGIGYNDNDLQLGDGVFYKFSYPGLTMLFLDSTEYNGDTLYYSYGKVDDFAKSTIGVKNSYGGIPGESGSSLIKIENADLYTSYGVLSYSGNLTHSRITNATFHAIEKIITPFLTLNNTDSWYDEQFYVYPNPAYNHISIESKLDVEIENCALYNLMGFKIWDISIHTFPKTIDISNLAQGCYIVRLVADNNIVTLKFIKSAY